MILLSALLASLTGLMAGERPVQPAQVELSAAVTVVQKGEAAVQARIQPQIATFPIVSIAGSLVLLAMVLPVPGVRARLSRKMSWLI